MQLKTALILLTFASLLAVPASANVWYTFTVHSDDACATKPRSFFFADMTQYAKLLAANTSLTAQTSGTSVNVAAEANTCADYIAAHKTFTSLVFDVYKTWPLQTNVSIPATMVTDPLLSNSMVDWKYLVTKLDDVLAGACIPNTQTELIPERNIGYVKTGCTILTDIPSLPESQDLFGVQAHAVSAGATDCLRKATIMTGLVADGKCRPESGFNAGTERVCIRATCDGMNPGAVVTIDGQDIVATAVLPEHYNVCWGTEGEGSKLLFQCQPGTGAAGGGWSLVKGETNATHEFVQGTTSGISLDGNVDLNLQPSTAAVTVNVTVAPRPLVADASPMSGINTFWKFSATGEFSAQLNWTFTEEILGKFNYTAEELRWARYNETSGKWDVKNETVVDMEHKSVLMTTNAFSEWTIVAAGQMSGALTNIPSVVVVLGFLMLSMAGI